MPRDKVPGKYNDQFQNLYPFHKYSVPMDDVSNKKKIHLKIFYSNSFREGSF